MNNANWPFDPLPPLAFDVVLADPPWSFATYSAAGKGKSAEAHYATMTLDAIKVLPVGQLARGDAWLWLWATHPMIDVAIDVMRAWGFRFVTSGVWSKRSENGLAFGTGYVLRCASEPFLIGAMGKPRVASRSVRTIIEAPRREHSRKPDESYREAERLFGPGRRADLFARESRPGWEPWGHEVGKFNTGAAA